MKLPKEVHDVINKVIKEAKLPTAKLTEGYISQPKQFKQVGEFTSQKTKDSHEELYKKYIVALNSAVTKLDSASRNDAAADLTSNFLSLKKDETFNLNATWLHELYFSGSFDPNSEIHMDSKIFIRLQRDFGTFDDWQRDFIALANSVGNGWVIMGYHPYISQYRNFIVTGHDMNIPVGMIPIIVLDMWEHAYARDYNTDKQSYIISQLRQINWKVANERLEKCELLRNGFRNGY